MALLTPRAAVPMACVWSHLMQLLVQLAASLTEKMSALLSDVVEDVVDPVPCCQQQTQILRANRLLGLEGEVGRAHV